MSETLLRRMIAHRRALPWLLAMACIAWAGCARDDGRGRAAGGGVSEGGDASRSLGCDLPSGLTTVQVAGIAVDVVVPQGRYAGDLLVLPPWGGKRQDWCAEARLCQRATKRGYRLILPEIGNTIYARSSYPETREDWRESPTIGWLKDALIPELRQRHCLLREGGPNFVIGASSGARGAVLLAQELPSLFVAVAALSGDYDPSLLPGDNVYRGFLGEYATFSERWKATENIVGGADRIHTPLYLGHGLSDELVSHEQTTCLYAALQKRSPDVQVELSLVEGMGGDWHYWSWELRNVFTFFEGTLASGPEGAM
jgi:dienelactone hydrolase